MASSVDLTLRLRSTGNPVAATSIALATTHRSISRIDPNSSAAITNSPAGIRRRRSTIRRKSSWRIVAPLATSTMRWPCKTKRSLSKASSILRDQSSERSTPPSPGSDSSPVIMYKDHRRRGSRTT